MSRYVEFTLPDGDTVVIESNDAESGVVKAGLGDITERAHGTFEHAAENARKAAMVILEKVRGLHDMPDEVEITFGLKASGELGTLVVAKAGVEASYSVRLSWKRLEAGKDGTRS